MSLLREIEEAVVDSSVDVSVLLRKCKVLAARLDNDDFKLWVDYELNGYPNIETLPDYRVLQVESYGNFIGIGWAQRNNAPIPTSSVPQEYRRITTTQYMTEPISYYSSLVQGVSGGQALAVDWPADLLAYLSDEMIRSWTCIKAWKRISAGSIYALLDTVKNRILSFVLTIEAEAPHAGETSPDNTPIADERLADVFHTVIMGNVGHFSAGDNQSVTYNMNVTVVQDDMESLRQFLTSIGVGAKDLDELEQSIREDAESATERRIGDRVRSWLGRMITKAGTTSWTIATSVAANLLTQALTNYYGFQI